MTTETLLLALLSGHTMGDFVLQNRALEERKVKSSAWVVIHVLIVAGVTWAFLGSIAAWPVVLLAVLLHFIIDVITRKTVSTQVILNAESCEVIELQRAYTAFLIDQLLHLLSIIILIVFIFLFEINIESCWVQLFGSQLFEKGLVLILGFSLGVWGIGSALQYQMAALAREVPCSKKKGLLKGGKTIGLLERTLVLSFVLAGKPEGVAFVVAAKSVFRIGDLTDQGDRLHAEYIMIGTLRSFTYSLVVAFLMRWFFTRAA